MLRALEILETIHSQMSLENVLRLVIAAKAELNLKDTAQVARELGVARETVIKRAIYYDIGTKIVRRARVYGPSDIEKLRQLISTRVGRPVGQTPETVEMIEKMRAMRDNKATLYQIGLSFGYSESYVCKLLKEETLD